VDIRVISLEICRKKLNPKLTEKFIDPYDEIVDFLDSKGFRIHKNLKHTKEELALEVIFVRKDIAFPGNSDDTL
jgi:hypothetical protein